MKLTMTVDVEDDRIVAKLIGDRPAVLSRDRIADLFLDAVWAALADTEPDQDDEPPADAPAVETPPQARPVDLADQDAVQREALRRLDAGEHLDVVAQQLGLTAATLRRWDSEPAPSTPDRSAIDWAAVDAVLCGRLRGDDVRVVDRREAVRQLTERGMSADQIAARTGMSQRTVVRHRTAAS